MKQLNFHDRWRNFTTIFPLAVLLIFSLSFSLWAASYQCIQDTYFDRLYPDDNFGGCDRLLIANNDEPTRVLMKFKIPGWVEISSIKSARIIIYSAPWTGGGGGETEFEIYPLTQSWIEGSCARYNDPHPDDGATWNQYEYDSDYMQNQWNNPGGDYDSSCLVSGTFPVGNEWGPFSIDVTPIMKNSLDNLRDYGFLIKHPSEDMSGGWQNFASRDSTGYDPPRHPCLEIDFFEPPPNEAPYLPGNPFPVPGDTGVAINTTLSWSGGDPDPEDIVTFDVYFGVPGELSLVSAGQTGKTYNPGTLLFATTYEWQIVARDNYGNETAGPVWNFTTTKTGISSISPESGSPFYFKDKLYIPRPVFVQITGEGTNFQFPESKVGFGDEGIRVLLSRPVSVDELWTAIIITKSVRAGLHDVTVTSGSEVAVGVDIFEVKKFWREEEEITVVKGSVLDIDSPRVAVPLWGLPIHTFEEKEALRLSDIVDKSGLTENPEEYFYNLIATDGYSLERGIIIGGWETGLPSWNDMEKGYLYKSESYGLLTGWEEDTTGGQIGHCYNVKWMDGGIIEIREKDMK